MRRESDEDVLVSLNLPGPLHSLTASQRAAIAAELVGQRPQKMFVPDLLGPLVYFIESGPSGPVKIGWTARSIRDRLNELQTGNPSVLKLLGCVRGGQDLERICHRVMREFHLRGEWYEPAAAGLSLDSMKKLAPSELLFDGRSAPVEST